MASKYYILMADVVKGRANNSKKLQKALNEIETHVNTHYKEKMLSPLTVTLGDEFQCIPVDLKTAIKLVFDIDFILLATEADFKLRYIINRGIIETKINSEIAYGMIGEGLSRSRELLNNLKKIKVNYSISIDNDKKNKILTDLFFLYNSIITKWSKKDYKLISGFLTLTNYRTVAELYKKDPSQTWKRRKTLRIMEFKTIKELIEIIAE